METGLRTTFQLLMRRYAVLSEKCCECCCDSGTTLMQNNILHEIDRHSHPSMQDVAHGLNMDITTFSRQVKVLIERNLVKKTPVPHDQRVHILSLTEEGQRLNARLDRQMNDYLDDVLSRLSEFERHSVVNALHLLDDAMQKSNNCCLPRK